MLSPDARAALTLKVVGGLTTDEIARAFLSSEATIAQRIVRAKKAIAKAGLTFEAPHGAERAARLPLVLEVIYLSAAASDRRGASHWRRYDTNLPQRSRSCAPQPQYPSTKPFNLELTPPASVWASGSIRMPAQCPIWSCWPTTLIACPLPRTPFSTASGKSPTMFDTRSGGFANAGFAAVAVLSLAPH